MENFNGQINEIENGQNEKDRAFLEAVIKLIPTIQQLFPIDTAIGVADKEKFLFHSSGKELDLGDLEGKPIPKGTSLDKALQTEKVASVVVPKEAYGISFKASAAPLKNEQGKVIGAMAIGMSLKNQEMLVEIAQSFVETSEVIASTTEELAASAQELTGEMENLNSLQKKMMELVGKTDAMLGIIEKLAKNSNLLGLNAAIESARAGQQGRGFEVVANEIRKMAANSAKTVEEVKEVIETLKSNVDQISEATQKISEIIHQQAAASQEISATTQTLADSAGNIEKVAQII